MKIKLNCCYGQVCWVFFLLCVFIACNVKKEEAPVIPPLSSPLSQPYIGFGVVNVSYTRVNSEPADQPAPMSAITPAAWTAEDDPAETASPGYLRRGAIVRIHERRLVRDRSVAGNAAGGSGESWVLVEGASKGWLKESLVDVYETELQARTASESMSK